MKSKNVFVALVRIVKLIIATIRSGDFKSLTYLMPWVKLFAPGRSPLTEMIPWINFKAIDWLKLHLTKEMVVFEYGSGGSTLFFAQRVKKVTSIEHNKKWYKLVTKKIKQNNLKNCECILKEPENWELKTKAIKGYSSNKDMEHTFVKYVNSINNFKKKSLDIVFIDGRARNSCISHAIPKIKKGGYLILDNSQRQEYTRTCSKLLGKYKRTDFVGFVPFISLCLGKTTVWEIN
jgi:precorrin-6B methylase 2